MAKSFKKSFKSLFKDHTTYLVIVSVIAVIAVVVMVLNFSGNKALVGEGYTAMKTPDTIMKTFTCPEKLVKSDSFKNMPAGFTMYPRYLFQSMVCEFNSVLCTYKSEYNPGEESYPWEFIKNTNVKECLLVGTNSCKCKTA